ncbi:MAG: hypothetical protein ACK5QX_08490 [bacterium]
MPRDPRCIHWPVEVPAATVEHGQRPGAAHLVIGQRPRLEGRPLIRQPLRRLLGLRSGCGWVGDDVAAHPGVELLLAPCLRLVERGELLSVAFAPRCAVGLHVGRLVDDAKAVVLVNPLAGVGVVTPLQRARAERHRLPRFVGGQGVSKRLHLRHPVAALQVGVVDAFKQA